MAAGPEIHTFLRAVLNKGNKSADANITAKLQEKVQLLDNRRGTEHSRDELRKAQRMAKRRARYAARNRPAPGAASTSLLQSAARFEDYLPLYELWKGYIADLVAGTDAAGAGARLLKADLQGAMVAVTAARCPALVGVRGLLLLETAHTLQLIEPTGCVRLVPKRGVVLALAAGPHAVTLHASQLTVRPADRAARRWKAKPTIEL